MNQAGIQQTGVRNRNAFAARPKHVGYEFLRHRQMVGLRAVVT